MTRKEIISALILAAAVMAVSPGLTWSQSVGETQSERSGSESQTPLPPGSPSAGSGDAGKAGKSPATPSQPSGKAQSNKDTSVGGTQSERSGSDTQTPLPKGSRSATSSDPSKVGQGPRSASGSQGMGGQQDVRQAQEALKNQGHDPGPVDGVMGSQTRHALREFQSKNGLKQTGMLDAETKQKLNIEGSGSGPMGRGDTSTRQKESSSPMGK
jgi:Putative peptidoglycan binding domain